MTEIIESLKADPLQLLIPLIAGAVGYITNVLAVKMMFYPTEFVGWRPYLGWQGIVPANAVRLANVGLQLVTSKILNIKELFDGFDGGSFVEGSSDEMKELTRKVVERQAEQHFPEMWANMPDNVKDQITQMAHQEVVRLGVDVANEAAGNIDQLIDVSAIVNAAIVADKGLMAQIFQQVGSAEFKFIEVSGWWFGLAFGIVQLIIWVLYPKWWILPFFGFLVGYATNWLALKLIFDPKEPKQIGPLKIQGLFHRRQREIAKEFSQIMSSRILSTENIFAEMSSGDSRQKMLDIVEKHGDGLIERYKTNPLAAPLFGQVDQEEMREELMAAVEGEMFRKGGFVYSFVDKAEDIRRLLHERMSVMEADDFEGVLRPAFKQDEWKLILAGAVLGLGAGFLQLFGLFGDLVG